MSWSDTETQLQNLIRAAEFLDGRLRQDEKDGRLRLCTATDCAVSQVRLAIAEAMKAIG